MIKIITLSISLIFMASFAQADQLQWLTKKQANEAKALIETKESVTIYCGCCDDSTPKDLYIKNVEIMPIEGEDMYEIKITYGDAAGQEHSKIIDLAYTWIKDGKKSKTVGELLKLKHDPCKRL